MSMADKYWVALTTRSCAIEFPQTCGRSFDEFCFVAEDQEVLGESIGALTNFYGWMDGIWGLDLKTRYMTKYHCVVVVTITIR